MPSLEYKKKLDVETSIQKLQAIFDAAHCDSVSLYKPFFYDMVFSQMKGYDKIGNDATSREVLNALEKKWGDGQQMPDK